MSEIGIIGRERVYDAVGKDYIYSGVRSCGSSARLDFALIGGTFSGNKK